MPMCRVAEYRNVANKKDKNSRNKPVSTFFQNEELKQLFSYFSSGKG